LSKIKILQTHVIDPGLKNYFQF